MNNNHYTNLIAYNSAIQNTQNLNHSLLRNPYINDFNFNSVLNYNSANRILGNSVNNINPISNFSNNNHNNVYSLNNEVIKNNSNVNNRNLVFTDNLFNPAFQVNCSMQQMPILANNFNFNSINREQDKLKIDSFNFNKFNDSVKLNNNYSTSIFDKYNLLGNNLNHGIDNFTYSANTNNALINESPNPMLYSSLNGANPTISNTAYSENSNYNQNYPANVLSYLNNLQKFQRDHQGTYWKANLTNYNNNNNKNNENLGFSNNIFNSMYHQIKNQHSDLSNTINNQNYPDKANSPIDEIPNNNRENFNHQSNDKTPLQFIELIKHINNNLPNDSQTDEESCDLNKVLNCYLFLKKNNLITNSNTVTGAKECLKPLEAKESNLIKNRSRSSEINFSKPNDSINSATNCPNNSTNNNKNPNSNNITNNYNYILNNYNVNITPNEGSNILKSITTLVLEKETNKASDLSNVKDKANYESYANKNFNNFSDKGKASQVLNAFLNSNSLTVEKAEKKALSADASNDYHLLLNEKAEKEISNKSDNNININSKDNKDKKVKFSKNIFCLEKMPTKIQIDIVKSKSEKSVSSNSPSSESYNCAKINQISKKICFKSNKAKEKEKEKEKEKIVSTRRSNITKRNQDLEKEQENKEFNCYNEFYLDGERNDSLKKELEEYSQFYEDDLAETLKDEKHSFMKSHFPEMYLKKDNFYFNIKMLNKKRKSQALLNSAYKRNRSYLKRNINSKFGLSRRDLEVKNKMNLCGKNQRILDVYDIFFNFGTNNSNNKDRNNLNLTSFDKAKKYINYEDISAKNFESSEANGNNRKNSLSNANIEIEINLNMNPDSESNYSPEKADQRKKSFEMEKLKKAKDKFLNDPNYVIYTNIEGINLINSVDFIDSESNKQGIGELDLLQEKKSLHDFDKNNLNISNAAMNKIWDNKVIINDQVDNFLYEIEKYWPFDEFHWSQEYALQFLMENKYDLINCKRMIRNKEKLFLDFMRNQLNKKDNFLIKSDSRKPGIKLLRRNHKKS